MGRLRNCLLIGDGQSNCQPLACGSQIYKLDKINSAAKNDIQNPVVYYAVFSPGLGDRTNWQEAPSHIWFLFHGRVLQPTHSFS